AAELQKARDQTLGASERHLTPVGHAAGKTHEIGLGDDILTGTPVAEYNIEHLRELGHSPDGVHQWLHEARCDFARLQQYGTAREQRGYRIEQRKHHGRVPGTDDANDRIRNELRTDIDSRHGQRRATHARALQHTGRILTPTIDVGDGDERGELRGVTTPSIGAVRDTNGTRMRNELRDPPTHDDDAIGNGPRGPLRLVATKSRSLLRNLCRRRRSQSEISRSGAWIAHRKRLGAWIEHACPLCPR